MKQVMVLFFLLAFAQPVPAQNEIGPEGHKLLWIFLFFGAALILLMFFIRSPGKGNIGNKPFVRRRRISVELVKDRLYYPDELQLLITNTGNIAIDLDRPLLVFSSIWMKRKFRIRGTNHAAVYPLFLDQGQQHTLDIDLNRFYAHDKHLKRLPKVKVIVYGIEGKKLRSKSVFLRKTLFKF